MSQFLVTLAFFSVAFAALAIGVIVTGKKELKGSCGGPDANPDCCQVCPEKDACGDVPLDIEVPVVAEKAPHPALAQVPANGPASGSPVATR